ncbi:MAG: ABC transporter permease [Lysobacterales bacterium]
MKIVRFSLRQVRREWRAGELRALALALTVSAAALTSVGAFSERVRKALTQGANELLAADLVIQSRQVVNPQWADEAERRGLSSALTIEFPTVAFSENGSLLVQVKGVSSGYPLRGKLEVAQESYGATSVAVGIPDANEAWVDPRVLAELGLEAGQLLELGDSQFSATQTIALEPDAGGGVFNLAPRVMLAFESIEKAGLLGPGARVQYRQLIAGDPADVEAFSGWLKPKLNAGESIQTLADSQQQIGRALDRANQFLMLAALTAVLLAGIAIVIAVRQFVERHLDTVAILRCLGSRQADVIYAFSLVLLWTALPALLLGAAIGYASQQLLIGSLGDLLPAAVPQAGPRPAMIATGIGLLTLLGYGLPPLLRLRRVPPVRVLNRQMGNAPASQFTNDVIVVIFSLGLIWWLSSDIKLGAVMAGASLGAGLLLAGGAYGLIRLARRLAKGGTLGWRYGIANLARRNRGVLMQVAGLGLGLTAIFLLGVVQRDLMTGWRNTLPANAPNFFLINVQPDQVDTIGEHFERNNADTQGLFPLAVTRLTAINDKSPSAQSLPTPRARRRIDGNMNISWSDELSVGNTIVQGQWQDPAIEGPQISLAQSWSESMGLALGDRLTFSAGAIEITGTVSSIRTVDWDSFQPNFFITFSSAITESFPHTFISSLFLPEGQFSVVADLVRQVPNVSVIDVGTLMNKVRDMIERVSLTVQVVFVFTLLAGVVVLLAALSAGLSQRQHEGAVMRTLGGSSRQLRSAIFSEFATIGAVAGLLAAIAALGAGALLAREVFEIAYQVSWWLPALGLVLGGVCIGTTGLLGSRSVLRTPPMVTLRQGH